MITQKQKINLIKFLNDIKEAPIILALGGWDIPAWLKRQIIIRRLLQKEEFYKEATDEECLAYLYTASLNAPLATEYVNIYMFLVNKVLSKKIPIPDELKKEKISDYEQKLLEEMKRNIRKESLKRRVP